MHGYLGAIQKATGVANERTLRLIEDVMRTESSTLDGLPLTEFNSLARVAWQVVQTLYPAVA